ncbi:YkvI family membrane protein [Sporolactobacillus vineae]|uniref:YkvI family membrane protein n=1 Tax=Sporolactobacillus vineae TaxID=444463 RepID=UPI000289CB6E|nr:transporter [Sporolactobacillus vineae]
MLKKAGLVLQIAATFIGTIVGAGFASGREVIQFFTRFGSWGTAGVLFSGLLMALIGTRLMLYARRIHAGSFDVLIVRVFGVRTGLVIHSLVFLIIFGVNGVMLAGSGAVFQEQLGWNRWLGMGLSIVLSLFFIVKKARGLLWVNSLVVPVLTLFLIILFIHEGGRPPQSPAPWQSGWMLSAFAYAAFNLSTALVVFVPLASEVKSERVLVAGGLVGGAGFTVLLLIAHQLILAHPGVMLYDMPTAELVRPVGAAMHLAFTAVIFGEILTTYVGNIFGLSRQLSNVFPSVLPGWRAVAVLIVGSAAVGIAGYSALIRVLYPFYGFLCMFLLICLSFVRIPER